MAKKETQELTTQKPAALVRPDFIPAGNQGLENLEHSDFTMPRLAVAQKMSKALESSDKEFIDGLQFGQYYNNLTKVVYGEEVIVTPIYSFIMRMKYTDDRTKLECMSPNGINGGSIAPVCADCVHSQFGDAGEAPACNRLFNYVVYIHDTGEIATVSFKGASVKSGKKFNMLMKLRNTPSYAGKYRLSVQKDKNDRGVFAVLLADNYSVTGDIGSAWVTPEQFASFKDLYESFAANQEKIADAIHKDEVSSTNEDDDMEVPY